MLVQFIIQHFIQLIRVVLFGIIGVGAIYTLYRTITVSTQSLIIDNTIYHIIYPIVNTIDAGIWSVAAIAVMAGLFAITVVLLAVALSMSNNDFRV